MLRLLPSILKVIKTIYTYIRTVLMKMILIFHLEKMPRSYIMANIFVHPLTVNSGSIELTLLILATFLNMSVFIQ